MVSCLGVSKRIEYLRLKSFCLVRWDARGPQNVEPASKATPLARSAERISGPTKTLTRSRAAATEPFTWKLQRMTRLALVKNVLCAYGWSRLPPASGTSAIEVSSFYCSVSLY